VFVHISAVEARGIGSLNEGDKLSYELEKDRKSGKNVRRATPEGLSMAAWPQATPQRSPLKAILIQETAQDPLVFLSRDPGALRVGPN